MELKSYQKNVIADLTRYLDLLNEGHNAKSAYAALWNEKNVIVDGGINGMPFYQTQDDVFGDAINMRRHLEAQAVLDQKETKRYIRPIVLIQAQAQTKADSTTYQKVKDKLLGAGIPASHIAIKTADKDELKGVDLRSPDCPIRYIITVNALKEG